MLTTKVSSDGSQKDGRLIKWVLMGLLVLSQARWGTFEPLVLGGNPSDAPSVLLFIFMCYFFNYIRQTVTGKEIIKELKNY